jgi:hypothetical protein
MAVCFWEPPKAKKLQSHVMQVPVQSALSPRAHATTLAGASGGKCAVPLRLRNLGRCVHEAPESV